MLLSDVQCDAENSTRVVMHARNIECTLYIRCEQLPQPTFALILDLFHYVQL